MSGGTLGVRGCTAACGSTFRYFVLTESVSVTDAHFPGRKADLIVGTVHRRQQARRPSRLAGRRALADDLRMVTAPPSLLRAATMCTRTV
jgi:hypothetical protein